MTTLHDRAMIRQGFDPNDEVDARDAFASLLRHLLRLHPEMAERATDPQYHDDLFQMFIAFSQVFAMSRETLEREFEETLDDLMNESALLRQAFAVSLDRCGGMVSLPLDEVERQEAEIQYTILPERNLVQFVSLSGLHDGLPLAD